MALLEGLHTGEADADRDGFVSVSDLVGATVVRATAEQVAPDGAQDLAT